MHGPLDAAPFAGVFFLLVLMVLLTQLVYTPGVRLELPMADDLPGTAQRTVAVAVDATGRFFFRNQLIAEDALRVRLREAAQQSPEPLTLVVQADREVKHETLIRLTQLARAAGIHEALLATLPRPFAPSEPPAHP